MNLRGDRVILIARTESASQLAAIYTAADLLFNSTREENYPTVNLESEACGTPVVTYDSGGCRETIHLKNSISVNGFNEVVKVFIAAAFM